jgi:hypothetical protein
MRFSRTAIFFCATLLVGCGLFPSVQEQAVQKSPNFRAGYSDGCAAASTTGANPREGPYRDQALYNSDAAYRTGWSNGYSLCRGGSAPGAGLGNPVTNPVPGQR